MQIAVVEDDDGVGDALVEALTSHGHRPIRMRRGADLLLGHRDLDVVILDLGLPDADGLQVLRQLRAVNDVPVVILTARGDERSVVRGLRGGADDYLVKPARLAELLARVDVVTQRRRALSESSRIVRAGDVVVDLDAREVEVGGEPVTLTPKEFDLLAVLVARPGAAVSRQQLMDAVWGDAYVAISRSLDVHMTGLRAKLARPGLISTIRGYGYRWGG
ncbi:MULTISPECIES: response regulator transcription factor [Rhodococcus]|uniref:OmpR family two-component response regulator n=2 Tax=Rhodococcus TaxID=1827 RepID=H0JT22_9NOCA|nr:MULTISPECIES: response regulator transcription factor [Rhodococcus]AOD23326.1 DNA-binding response regulator [Rhodococcus sp. p52]APE09336.1 DNA-binding response regulator [Rhodococcus sp. 2G]EHK82935.1 OmpR family two-component response regulator [Rhodococcus pyridinivorans AK37]MBX4170000.1 response regulator transcription factor [Rhodococcus sp. DMU2021]MCD2118692.1 response regulator transcription factor [Rhodococcus pyridinivorans]